MAKRSWTSILPTLTAATLSLVVPARVHGQESARHGADSKSWVRYWNQVAINASGLDHTPVAPDEHRVFGEQFGPCRASRAYG